MGEDMHTQIIPLPVCERERGGVQAVSASHEPVVACVFPAGGHQEPGQDCAAGGRPPGSHGGGEGPAAGQRLRRGQG